MRLPEPPIHGTFVRRYKRFFADVELADGTLVTVHCPNTGSLTGCLVPGRPVLLRDSNDPKRKLRYTWQAIRIGRSWVNVHTGLPNALVAEAATAGKIPELDGYASLRREVPYGERSRVDLLLEDGPRPPCWVEVKSTTLAEGRIGYFPDAVTARGLKHLGELVRVVEAGDRAVQFFLVSRNDVTGFRPADHVDPAYGEGLRDAAERGVEVVAYTARVSPRTFELGKRIEVDLAQR